MLTGIRYTKQFSVDHETHSAWSMIRGRYDPLVIPEETTLRSSM